MEVSNFYYLALVGNDVTSPDPLQVHQTSARRTLLLLGGLQMLLDHDGQVAVHILR